VTVFIVISIYLALGSLIAYAMNASFDLGGPIDPGAGSSPSTPKWVILPAIALLWPLAIFIPIIAVMSWIRNGSH
jgi:hypothetical protein